MAWPCGHGAADLSSHHSVTTADVVPIALLTVRSSTPKYVVRRRPQHERVNLRKDPQSCGEQYC
jgi:hypothetical protein